MRGLLPPFRMRAVADRAGAWGPVAQFPAPLAGPPGPRPAVKARRGAGGRGGQGLGRLWRSAAAERMAFRGMWAWAQSVARSK
ncbi:hypothetical protein ALMP_62590 [Streptomyces sp. A012304]|nr:hypothetical protein ALMP_62590 [Streptomyces sp. A012304]